MTALERLLAEAEPDGTFGGNYPRLARPYWTPAQQAQHRADLLAALDGREEHQPIPRRPRKAA